mgnify:FL=1
MNNQADERQKITILTLQKHKRIKHKTVLTTAYSDWQAHLVDDAGIDVIVVGDSIAMTEYGYATTIPMTMEVMLPHCTAVWRGSEYAMLIGDMPFGSYQESNEQAVRNANEFIRHGMDAVKVEGAMIDRIKSICQTGVLVMSHLGLTPQTRAKLGGYRVQGKTLADVEVILDQAKRLQDAGCSFLLLEAVPRESAGIIAAELEIPIYGIGAGDLVDGQLVIFHDLVGLFRKFKSKFVKRYAECGDIIRDALAEYAREVRDGKFPAAENFYELKEEELEKLLADDRWKYVLERDKGMP